MKSIYLNGPRHQELIDRLRDGLCLTKDDVNDSNLIAMTRNTLFFARVELAMSLAAFKKELIAAITNERRTNYENNDVERV